MGRNPNSSLTNHARIAAPDFCKTEHAPEFFLNVTLAAISKRGEKYL